MYTCIYIHIHVYACMYMYIHVGYMYIHVGRSENLTNLRKPQKIKQIFEIHK